MIYRRPREEGVESPCLLPRVPLTYQPSTLWGNTFCQGFRVGLASYHFASSSAGYISYEHDTCGRSWPPLDDGSPIPSRVPFRNIQWDLSTRTFTGTIEWEHDYGTTWRNCQRWIYEIRFDEQYTFIVSGHVDGEERTMATSSAVDFTITTTRMSVYGENLLYVNAALDEYIRRELEGLQVSTPENDQPGARLRYAQFQSLWVKQRPHWQAIASVRSRAMLHHAATRIIIHQENPIERLAEEEDAA